MAGATPVAFSFLGDLFHTEQRNAASSALTSCMGAGIALGQVYAGTVGPRFGWQVSGNSVVFLTMLHTGGKFCSLIFSFSVTCT